MKRIIDIPEEVIEAFENGDINFCYYDYNSLIGKAIRNSTPINECEAEDYRRLKDIKELVENKATALDGKMLDAGGICIGLFFAIANDLPSVYPKSDKVLEDIKAELNAYGSLWVSYTINGHTDSDIQKLVEDVLKQAKEQVLDVIDRHISGEEQ